MKKLILLLLVVQLFGFEGAVVKGLSKFFSKTTIEVVASKYGSNGIRALERLAPKYGSRGVEKLEMISAKYGNRGIALLAKYGEIAVKNKNIYNESRNTSVLMRIKYGWRAASRAAI